MNKLTIFPVFLMAEIKFFNRSRTQERLVYKFRKNYFHLGSWFLFHTTSNHIIGLLYIVFCVCINLPGEWLCNPAHCFYRLSTLRSPLLKMKNDSLYLWEIRLLVLILDWGTNHTFPYYCPIENCCLNTLRFIYR